MDRKFKGIDLPLLLMYLVLVIFGILNIYSISLDFAIKQCIWFVFSLIIVSIIFTITPNFFENFAVVIYFIGIVFLILLFPFGSVINGSKSWFKFRYMNLQPVEIVKIGTSLMLGYLINSQNFDFSMIKSKIQVFLILLLPIILILLQPDFGSVLVFFSFLIVLYREGLSGFFFLLGGYFLFLFFFSIYNLFNILFYFVFIFIGLFFFYLKNFLLKNIIYLLLYILLIFFKIYFLFTYLYSEIIMFIVELLILLYINYVRDNKKFYWVVLPILCASIFVVSFSEMVFNRLPKHQKNRIALLFEGEDKYRHTTGYNLLYSKTSIGSGGFFGKGFNCGTITDGKFVPEQHTDYILSVVGEEWGFLGTSLLLIFYACFIIRIYFISEKQTVVFNRVIGYSIGSIFLVHFIVNVGMVIGMMPTVGIPLPYFSYGGSSLLSFSIMLFIFLRLNFFDKRI